MERLEVRIITFNETVVQKNGVKTLYRHGKPLEEELALVPILLPSSDKKSTAESLIGPSVSSATG